MKEIQKDIDIDWKKIDETINEAIERDEPYILFKFMEIEEYRYGGYQTDIILVGRYKYDKIT